MSKLTQIETALHSMDASSFQRLCDSYLYKKGYEHINAVGLVIGQDKVAKGTPDTLITRPDGRYDFAEYSTQQDGLATKFAGDVANCLNEQKTGIPVARIHSILLCHNGRVTPEQENSLLEQCLAQGVMLSIFGPSVIAQDLYQKHPGLAHDFLGVEIDTGQILSSEDFVTAYNKRSFATPLDTTFKFREDELKDGGNQLNENDLLLITGPAGIGKTRFALEVAAEYLRSHLDAKQYCVINKGADLFEDLRVYFSESGHFLILVDDANRVNRLEYALQLLHEQRSDQKIKIIATVRDYALDAVERVARPFGGGALVELAPFNEEQIKELVRDNSEIAHPLYLDRIAEIAQGNPRLAIMAARVAERENTLQSIADVSALYDEYFASVRDDLDDLGDPTIILVAGIVSFFRIVDRSNSEMMGAIIDNFQIDAGAFWKAAERLHELEMVDMYEKEIVRISDQVLSTYLFYLSAFRERAMDFGVLLERFFPNFRYRLIDALNPVLSAFDEKAIVKILRPHVDRACDMAQQRGNEDNLMSLLDAFWFVKPTDTLIYLREKIDVLQSVEIRSGTLTFVKSNNLPPSPSILGILDHFRYADQLSMNIALSLVLDYLEKRPAELPLILRMLQESYGMTHYSHLDGFLVERSTVDAVWTRTNNGKNELFARLFLTIAEPLLHTRFQTSQSKSRDSLTIIDFDVAASEKFLEFRKTLWQRVFLLYSVPSLRADVLSLMEKHSGSGFLVKNGELIECDAADVLAFFRSSLDPSIYRHCVIVQDYVDLLERAGVEPQNDLRATFTNETYRISELVLVDRHERSELGWKEYQTLQRERLRDYTSKFDEREFAEFLKRCTEIVTNDGQPHQYQVQSSVIGTLVDLATRDSRLFVTVFQNYLQSGNILDLGPWALVAKLIDACGPGAAYELLSSNQYPRRVQWLFGYFVALPNADVSEARLQQLYTLYETANAEDLLRGMDHLLKFIPADKQVVIKVTQTLVARSQTNPKFGHALGDLFTERAEIGNKLQELFAGEIDLLKQAYFAANDSEDHEDFDGPFFNRLLDLDTNFGREWVAQLYQKVDRPSRHDDSRDYSFIWRRADFMQVIEQIVEAICACGKGRLIYDSYLQKFFVLLKGTADIDALHQKQDQFLDDIIRRRSKEKDLMAELFQIISGFSPGRRYGRFAAFVDSNQDYEMFERLPLESYLIMDNGSAVPRLQKRIEFLESLLSLFNTVELLRHRQRIETLIQRAQESIESEKRRDFMSDDF